ncbi:MAG TPA: secretin N-terminal domain-containing protein [Myxococcota bacterium]|nr:secretin N-terminal domain-containing protein [Myxococcota bacterium]
MRWGLAALWLCLACAAAARADDEKLTLNFSDSPPLAVVDAIARATGTRFVADSALRGQLTISLEDTVSPGEALEILNAALMTVGFAPVPAPDGSYKILPIEAAKSAAPWIHRSVSEGSERMVTTLVRLHAANAADLAKQLAPSDRTSLVIPYPPTNSLIIAAAEDRIAAMLDLLRALDQSAALRTEVLPLRYADAATTAQQLQTRFDSKDDTRPDQPLRIVADPVSNSLVVKGAPSRVIDVKKYVELVDVPRRNKSKVHVVRILNADAQTLAQTLSSLTFDDSATPSAGGRSGGSFGAAAPRPGVLGASALGAPVSAGAGLRGKRYTITADDPTNSLIIFADADTFGLIADTIAELDRIPPRIAVEAQVLSLQTTREVDIGFDAILPLIVPDKLGDMVAFGVFGNPVPLATSEANKLIPFVARFTRRPLVVPVVGPDGNPTTVVIPSAGAQITASDGTATVTSLASPYLLAASGQEQHVFAGSNVPVPVSAGASTSGQQVGTTSTTTPGSVSSAFQVNTQIQRQDVGVDFRVKPIALDDHMTALEVAINISSVAATASTTVTPLGPTINQIKLDAQVRIDDGSVVLISSAPKDTITTQDETVPWLGRIPFFGWLFKQTSDLTNRQRFIVTLQAVELHSPAEERAEQMERVIAFERRNLRMQPLRAFVTEPYALLVATRATREQAEDVLPELADLPGTPLVTQWTDDVGGQHFDVYLTGFPEIGPLGDESIELRKRGFTPRFEIAGEPRS